MIPAFARRARTITSAAAGKQDEVSDTCKLGRVRESLAIVVARILFGELGDETLDDVDDAINCLFG
jgi:hypothetical protein